MPSALNGCFTLVQNLYRLDFVVFKKVLLLSVLCNIERLPHACHMDGVEARLLYRMKDGLLFKKYVTDIPFWARIISSVDE